MHPTAMKNFYARIVFLLAVVFLSLFNGSSSFAQQNQVAKEDRLAGTVQEKNHLPLPDISMTIEKAEKVIISSISVNRFHIATQRTYVIAFNAINYTPQRISDIIKECPA